MRDLTTFASKSVFRSMTFDVYSRGVAVFLLTPPSRASRSCDRSRTAAKSIDSVGATRSGKASTGVRSPAGGTPVLLVLLVFLDSDSCRAFNRRLVAKAKLSEAIHP